MDKKRNRFLTLMLALFGAAALSLLLYFALSRLGNLKGFWESFPGILMPFLIGGGIAYVLKPSCNYIEKRFNKWWHRKKLAHGMSIFVVMFLSLGILTVLLVLVMPRLLSSLYSVLRLIPRNITQFSAWLLKYFGDNEVISNYITSITESITTSLPEWLSTHVLSYLEALIGGVSSSLSSLLSLLLNILLGIIVAIYMLGNRKTFARQAKMIVRSLFRPRWADKIIAEARYADRIFGNFINGRLLDSLIIGLICFVGMLIFRMPYVVLISVLVGITNIIPFFGPYIGGIPSFLLLLMISPSKALVFLIFIVVLQQFDGNILAPRVIGHRTGLPGFWVLFAILIFGGLYGFIGMIIGVPLFAVIYDIARQLVHRGLARQERLEAKRSAAGSENTDKK